MLVPGAGGHPWIWHRVQAELAGRGIEAIAVDLPGDDDAAGLAEYADAIVAAIGDRAGVVLVAQSLAGFSAPMACERAPVRRLVLLNAMIPLPGETPGAWWAATGQPEAMREHDQREGRPGGFDVHAHFLHDLPPDVLAASGEHVRRQSDTPFGQPWPLASWPDVPTTVLAGRGDRFFPAAFQRRVARERLGLEVEPVPGGHLAALSHPAELAERLAVAAAGRA